MKARTILILVASLTALNANAFVTSEMESSFSSGNFEGVKKAVVTLIPGESKDETVIEIEYRKNDWLKLANQKFVNEFEYNEELVKTAADRLTVVDQYQDECESTVIVAEDSAGFSPETKLTLVLIDHSTRKCENKTNATWEIQVTQGQNEDSILELVGHPQTNL